jgi:hypothetical protein
VLPTSTIWPRKISVQRLILRAAHAGRAQLDQHQVALDMRASVRSASFTTSTSLFSCLVSCSMTRSSPYRGQRESRQRGIIGGRDVQGLDVEAALREQPDHAGQAPGSFSINIEMIRRISGPLRLAEPHVPHRSGRDVHRIDVFVRVDDDVEKHQHDPSARTPLPSRVADPPSTRRACRHGRRPRQLHEIRQRILVGAVRVTARRTACPATA